MPLSFQHVDSRHDRGMQMHALKQNDPLLRAKRIARGWQELLVEMSAFAHELAANDEREQAVALLADARHYEARAQRHLKRLCRRGAVNDV